MAQLLALLVLLRLRSLAAEVPGLHARLLRGPGVGLGLLDGKLLLLGGLLLLLRLVRLPSPVVRRLRAGGSGA